MNAGRKLWVAVLALVVLVLGPVGAAWAQVRVTAADPASTSQGTTGLNVTISGSGFDASAAVKFLVTGTTNPGGIEVTKVVVVNSKKLVATINAASDATVAQFDIEVSLSGDRKGKGTTLFTVLKKGSDPCATPGLDFPAFAFWRPAGQGQEIFVADATGQCVRSVMSGTRAVGSLEFSYPVVGSDGLTRGRVVWVESSAIVAVDFTVAPVTNNITVDPRRTVYTGTGGYISLSRDGQTLYTQRNLESGGTVIEKVRLEPLGAPMPLFATPAGEDRFTMSMSVNEDESLLFADYVTYAGGSALYQLVWIPLDGTNAVNPIESSATHVNYTPAVAPGPSNRVVYNKPTDAGGICYVLVTSDVNGHPTYPAQLALGVKPTWLNGSILADGLAVGRRGSCDYTGTIMRTDPITGAQTALTLGRDPDGR